MEKGYLKGENCNRGNCNGIIQEHHSDGGCSCHINPPCSHCTTSREYCPECGWDGKEEQEENETQTTSYKGFENKEMHDNYYNLQSKRNDFDELYKSDELVEELRYNTQSHTHFTMIKYGVYPIYMTTSELRTKIDGTFGGRFESLDTKKGRFKFIAYTD